MRYDDRFRAHIDVDDPRNPVLGAGGCTWPTIPAWRYYVSNKNGRGLFSLLRDEAILLENAGTSDQHDFCQWSSIETFIPIIGVHLYKRTHADLSGFSWDLQINATGVGLIFYHGVENRTKCNKNFTLQLGQLPSIWTIPPIRAFEDPPGPPHDLGLEVTLEQVEYNQTLPPDHPDYAGP